MGNKSSNKKKPLVEVEKKSIETLKQNENQEYRVPQNTPQSDSVLNNELNIITSDNKDIKLVSKGGSLYEDIRLTYKFKNVLGGGHFGTVRIGYKKSDPEKKQYAIKSISKKNLKESDLDSLMQEVEILSNLDHPNIIKFYETYHDQFYFHIVMELCTGKEVFDKILEDGHIDEYKVANIVYKVLSAVFYCHNHKISHRDIKPENILFETNEKDSEIKLIDFGLSKKYDNGPKMHTILGTPYYVAPEVLKGEYNEKCDIWSLGAITYIMLSGEPPFNGKTNYEIFNKIVNNEAKFDKRRWKNISMNCIDFIQKCMIKNPNDRITAEEAIDHPWFKDVYSEIHTLKKLDPEILQNLKNFSSPSKFKKLVLRFLINQLSRNELIKLRNAFYAIDKDQHGQIDINELEQAFSMIGLKASHDELIKIIENSDEGHYGQIEYSEFLIASINQKKFVDKEKLISAFKYFDVDNSGYICSSDLKNVLLRSGKRILNQEEIDSIIDEVSNKNQHKVSLKEFLQLFEINQS